VLIVKYIKALTLNNQSKKWKKWKKKWKKIEKKCKKSREIGRPCISKRRRRCDDDSAGAGFEPGGLFSNQSKRFFDHQSVENSIGFDFHQKVYSQSVFDWWFDLCIWCITSTVKTQLNPRFLTMIVIITSKQL